MKKLLLPAVAFAAWIALLGTDLPAGKGFLPAMGRFFNPFQGIWQSVVPPDHDLQGTFPGGIAGETRILFDEREVPHIYAPTLADAMYAQGWLHANYRLFQMELTARATAGRLSEWLGPRTFEFDKRRREMGMEWMAREKVVAWSRHPVIQPLLEAYTDGVNSVTSHTEYRDWPVEYKILHQTPGEWSIEKSALVGLSMSISLCLKENDIDLTRARARLPEGDFAFLFPEHNPDESPVVPNGSDWAFTPLNLPDALAFEPDDPGGRTPLPGERNINGSNNWAVSPTRSASGHALLANDPHLNQTLPSIWYEVEIHTPEMHVHGVSIPGIPLVIIGFNPAIAWGTTNSGQDVLDWNKITWQDSLRHRYLLDGSYVDANLRPEIIDIRGRYPVTDSVRYTVFGPVASFGEHRDMAMEWVPMTQALENEVEFLLRIDQAGDVAGYRDAVGHFPYPAQNKVFASRTGDIAISVSGRVPLRNVPQGEYVRQGDTRDAVWSTYIPFDQNPFSINPPRGFVSSANQAPAGPDYPYPLFGRLTFEDWRGRTLNLKLDSLEHATVDDMKRLQQDNYDLQAAELLPLFLRAMQDGGCSKMSASPVGRQLAGWNFECHRDSSAPVAYDLWYRLFESMLYDELDSLGVIRPEEWRTVAITRDHPDHAIFDRVNTPDVREQARDIICASFEQMRDSLHRLDPLARKNWGAYKSTTLQHLARLPGFGIEGLHASGGDHILNAQKQTHGPSWRMIVEMSDPPQAWVNYPGGQSGHPASPHYADFVPSFFEGEYYPVTLRPDPSAWRPVREVKLLAK